MVRQSNLSSSTPLYLTNFLYPFAARISRELNHPIFFESRQPILDAINGFIYSRKGTYDLKLENRKEIFDPLEPGCLCPTCKHSYTQAYLHYLYFHTPLLCQRFLAQHNISYCNTLFD